MAQIQSLCSAYHPYLQDWICQWNITLRAFMVKIAPHFVDQVLTLLKCNADFQATSLSSLMHVAERLCNHQVGQRQKASFLTMS